MSEYEIDCKENVRGSKETIKEKKLGLSGNGKNFTFMINDPLILQPVSERLHVSKSQWQQ